MNFNVHASEFWEPSSGLQRHLRGRPMCQEAFLTGSFGRASWGGLLTDVGLQVLAGWLVDVGSLCIKSHLSGLALPSGGTGCPQETLTRGSCILIG